MEAAAEAMLYLKRPHGEIRKVFSCAATGQRRPQLETWLEVQLEARFAGRIVPIDAANWRSLGFARYGGKTKRKGLADIIAGLLAATPHHHNLTVVSRNTSDFTNTPVQVVNPWEG